MVGFFCDITSYLKYRMNLNKEKVKMVQKDDVVALLKQILYPGFNKDIVSFGIVKDIEISESSVSLVLDLRSKDQTIIQSIKEAVESKLRNLPNITSTSVSIARQNGSTAQAEYISEQEQFLPRVKQKIAIASGKGGVGKSTVSVNLAAALVSLGYSVGLLDSDIYGPSIPLMLGIKDRPEFDGQKLIPLEKYGIKLMSLGFLLTDNSPVIWRGPLVMRALQQLMRDVNWGTLDVILFDMPPGTGDAQLTLSQSVALNGAIIISTPQDVALLDAIKGVQMFRKVNVPIMGIIENMSYFICPNCKTRSDIFSAGGAKKECAKLQVDLLGEIPLDIDIRIAGDEGIPVVIKNPDNEQSKAFLNIAKKISNSFTNGRG